MTSTIISSHTITNGLTISSTIDSPVTVTAAGTIKSTNTNNEALYLTPGASNNWKLINYGVITGGTFSNGLSFGEYGPIASGTLLNHGTIAGEKFGVLIGGPAVVTNFSSGELVSYFNSAIYLAAGGTFVNAGFVNGNSAGNGVYVSNGTATIINESGGTITGKNFAGVRIETGGVVTNDAGATISGGRGVDFEAAGTLINSGVISETNGVYAVDFVASSSTNLVVAYAGASFSGKVNGGGGYLRLASSATVGTLTGFGATGITNFATLDFQPGAKWDLVGTGSVAFGSMIIDGFTANDTIDLTEFSASSSSFVSTASPSTTGLVLTQVNNGTTSHATLHIQGSFSTSDFQLASYGTGGTEISFQTASEILNYGTTIVEDGIVATSETVSAGGILTLFNSGDTAVGTIVVGTSLSSGDFMLRSDGSGGTDVIVDTVFGTYASGVTLLVNPTTIASTAAITGSLAGATGVYGPTGTDWTMANQGLVSETGDGSFGVSFASAGTITNAASGTIAGVAHGILLAAGGDVTNQSGGTIASGGTAISGAAAAITVVNAGKILGNDTVGPNAGVNLGAGGFVSNQSGGTIAGFYGINALNDPATVINAGIIAGNPTSISGTGIYLQAGGSVTNQSGGTISGYQGGVRVAGASGTVLNLGFISAATFSSGGFGVYLVNGGAVTNGQFGGTVSTAYIEGYSGGINFGPTNAGTLINYGTVSGHPGAQAVSMTTGTVVNGLSGATGALIYGNASGIQIGGAGTVINYGTILGGDGTHYYGVSLGGAGSVSNLGTGSLIQADGGVYADANDTVANAGTIASNSTTGNAVVFIGGTNRLIVDPGAVFSGTVSAAGTTTLELASAGSIGTLAGLGTDFTNFTALTFDSGARWTVTGNGSTSGLGTLTIGGFTFGDTIDLTGFAAVSHTFASNSLVLGNGSGGYATLAIQGSFSSGDFALSSDGSGGTDITLQPDLLYGDTVDEAGIVATTETVTAGTMTLFDSGDTAVGIIDVGTSLGSGDFILAPDGSSGTDVIVDAVFGTYTSGVTLLTKPTTITNTARISSTANSALFGPGGSPGWTVTNYGVVNGGTDANGVQLGLGLTNAGSGSITNAAGGTIAGIYGIRLYNAAGFTIVNRVGGTIAATGTIDDRAIDLETAAGTVTNAGLILAQTTGMFDVAVELDDGGTVINSAGGTISGGFGVLVAGAGTVINAGMISGVYSYEYAVAMDSGDRLIVDPGAVFIGEVDGGRSGGASALELASGASAGTLSGLGTQFVYFNAVTIDSGAGWTLSGSNTLASGATLTNSGMLTDSGTFINAGLVTGTARAILLTAGAQLTNQSGGTIIGATGIYASGTASVVNAGSVGGGLTSGIGIALATSGSVTNLSGGIITGGGYGVRITEGGYVTNASGGSITGADGIYDYVGSFSLVNAGHIYGSGTGSSEGGVSLWNGGTVSNASSGVIGGYNNGILVYNQPATIYNAGTIVGNHLRGVWLTNGGFISNASSGAIGGFLDGVYTNNGTIINAGTIVGLLYGVYAFNGTVTNAGTIESIEGTTGAAVYLRGDDARLIDDPGAVFIGAINGGAEGGLMELASAASAGTIFGFGTSITNFNSLVFDDGAQWTVAGNDSADGFGTLGISGFTAGDTIDLTGFVAVSETFASDALVLTDSGSNHETLNIQGTFTTNNFHIGSDGNGGTDITFQLHNPPVISGTVAGQTTTDEATLDPFSGVTIADPNIDQTETVTITLSNAANGTLSNLDGGTFNNGTYVVSGTTLAVTEALDGLVFTPTAHQVAPGDAVTTTFTISATDSDDESATDSTTTVIATAADDAPVITQAATNLGVPNENASTPFADLTVTDPDIGHTDTLTVTMSNPAGGAFSNLSDGSYDAATGSYTFTGSASLVTEALQALVFTPAAPTSGFVADTTGFSVVVTGPGGTATNDDISATAVAQAFGLGSAPSGDDAISVSPDGGRFPNPVDGDNNEAVVSDPSAGATYDLPSGYQAEFLGGTVGAALSDASVGSAVLIGNDGNDTLTAGAGNDTLAGGTGNNLLSVSGASDAIDVGSGVSTADAAGSDDTVYAGSGMTSVFTTGSDAAVFGSPGGMLSVVDTGAGDTIGAFDASSANVSLAGSNALLFGGSNSISVTASNTSQTIVGASGAASISITAIGVPTDDEVLGGSGSLTIDDQGQGDTIGSFTASQSNVTLGAQSSNDLLFGGTAALDATVQGTNDTVVGGSGSSTIDAQSGAIVFGGSGPLNFVGGMGTSTILGEPGGSEMVTVGSGGVLFFAGANDNPTIVGGSGVTTVFGNTGGSVVFSSLSGSGGLDFLAGSGNESLNAASSSTSNVFGFFDAAMSLDGGAHDTVTGWSSQDTLFLMGYDSTTTSTISGGGNFTVDLAHGATITFTDADSSAFVGRILYGQAPS